jgi:putative membrane protein
MLVSWIVAALHLAALGVGLGAVWARARALRGPLDTAGVGRVLYADNLWGLAALLWLITGLWRAFGGLEKGSAYYLHNVAFHLKMGLFVLVLLLELWPMTTFIRWRVARSRGADVDASRAPTFATISRVQAVLIVAMVFAASAMARGLGVTGR